MATRNSYPRDLPKISLIIIIVVFFFCISLVTAASSTSGTDTTTSAKGIGNIRSMAYGITAAQHLSQGYREYTLIKFIKGFGIQKYNNKRSICK